MALDEKIVAPSPSNDLLITPVSVGAGTQADWQTLAACRDLDPWLFYSSDPEDVSRARTVCSICPVRDACLQVALSTDRPGLLGGFTERERARLAMMTQSAPLTVLPRA